jgi:C-mannosyltransferase DPY19L
MPCLVSLHSAWRPPLNAPLQCLFLFAQAHILNLLRSKLGSYRDFHTMLYTCSPEFDFLPAAYWRKVAETLLLPAAGVALLALAAHALRPHHELKSRLEPELLYFVMQTAAFGGMALMVMRLKLFLTPSLCILASLLASRKVFLSKT